MKDMVYSGGSWHGMWCAHWNTRTNVLPVPGQYRVYGRDTVHYRMHSVPHSIHIGGHGGQSSITSTSAQ